MKNKIIIEQAQIEGPDQIGAFQVVNEVDAAKEIFREHGFAAIGMLASGQEIKTKFLVYRLKKD